MPYQTEPPILPVGEITLYHLSGEWGFSEEQRDPNTRSFPRFRSVPLLSSVVFTAELAASLRRSLGYRETYDGEPMRCFLPRHGLRFGDEGDVEALVCLECQLAFFWMDGREHRYALSETAVSILTTLFRAAEPASRGLDAAQALHEASFDTSTKKQTE